MGPWRTVQPFLFVLLPYNVISTSVTGQPPGAAATMMANGARVNTVVDTIVCSPIFILGPTWAFEGDLYQRPIVSQPLVVTHTPGPPGPQDRNNLEIFAS